MLFTYCVKIITTYWAHIFLKCDHLLKTYNGPISTKKCLSFPDVTKSQSSRNNGRCHSPFLLSSQLSLGRRLLFFAIDNKASSFRPLR